MRTNTKSAKLLILLSFFILMTGLSFGQGEKDKEGYSKDFEDFKKGIQQEFQAFKDKNDSLFVKFLKESWQEYDAFYNEKPARPKPDTQPVAPQKRDSTIKIVPSRSDEIILPQDRKPMKLDPRKTENIKRMKVPGIKTNFYGTPINIPFEPQSLSPISHVDANTIRNFFEQSAKSDYMTFLVYSLVEEANQLSLNDWGFLQLAQKYASGLYDDDNIQKVCTWFLLLKSGFNTKIGYNDNSCYLLIPTEQMLYGTYYLDIMDVRYFYLGSSPEQPLKASSITTYATDYPGSDDTFDLLLANLPVFPSDLASRDFNFRGYKSSVLFNSNLTEFYASYPFCELLVHFGARLSKEALLSVDSIIAEKMRAYTPDEKMNYLLKFVQHAIGYKTDSEQFGEERFLFAEETLSLGEADCEDRSILLYHLVQKYLGAPCVALLYPDHVSLAVALELPEGGDYLTLDEKKFFICDPTYIGAKAGMAMPDMLGKKPEILSLKMINYN